MTSLPPTIVLFILLGIGARAPGARGQSLPCGTAQQCAPGTTCCGGNTCCSSGTVCSTSDPSAGFSTYTCCPQYSTFGSTMVSCQSMSYSSLPICCPTGAQQYATPASVCCSIMTSTSVYAGAACCTSGKCCGGSCCSSSADTCCGPTCCPAGNTCVGTGSSATCCPNARVCGTGSSATCCSLGQSCMTGTLFGATTKVCCNDPGQTLCGSSCCNFPGICDSKTLPSACCPTSQLCGTACCAAGTSCASPIASLCCASGSSCGGTTCCPSPSRAPGTSPVCNSNGPGCCASANICGSYCCANGLCTSYGASCCPSALTCGTNCCDTGVSSGVCDSNGAACCPSANVCGRNCCASGVCDGSGGCCATSKICGAKCCGSTETCTEGTCVAATIEKDPHINLPGLLPPNQTEHTEFSFDFHGLPDRAYCMFTDTHLSVNAHMFGLPPDALIVEQRTSEVTPFYEGTWMDGMGFLYRNAEGAVQRLAIWLDRSATAYEKFPFSVYFEGKALGALDAAGWTSTDGIAKVVPSSERDAGLLITLKGLLEVEISRDFEEELFTDPPVQFLNLAIKSFTQGPSVHGFVGQMFREGAVEERLAMGTLEGLLHREYVEGTDDEYEASDLVSADCSFDLFSCQVGKDDESGVGAARKLLTAPPLVRDTLVRCAGPRYGTFSCRM